MYGDVGLRSFTLDLAPRPHPLLFAFAEPCHSDAQPGGVGHEREAVL